MSLVSLKTELRQELKLTPQLLQSMEILQMNSQELLEYLGKVSEENPLVEQEDNTLIKQKVQYVLLICQRELLLLVKMKEVKFKIENELWKYLKINYIN